MPDPADERLRQLRRAFPEAERTGMRFALEGRFAALALLGRRFALTRLGVPGRALVSGLGGRLRHPAQALSHAGDRH